jgi:hypothetical protein
MSLPIQAAELIACLQEEYRQQKPYKGNSVVINGPESVISSKFTGAGITINFFVGDTLSFEAPACVAAPHVSMVAQQAINFGMTGRSSLCPPVRLYAPNVLSITTRHLSIGDVLLLVEPKSGFISCKKLTLPIPQEEYPDYCEIIMSCCINDDMEIEKVPRPK